MDESTQHRILDDEYLRLLRIGYFIQGGTTSLMSVFGLLYVFMGIFAFGSLANNPNTSGAAPPPQFVGYIFAFIGALITLVGGTIAALHFLTAGSLRRRRRRTLCIVTAALSCLLFPYGTALGICTFMVLNRPGVRALFEDGSTQSSTHLLPTEPGPPGA